MTLSHYWWLSYSGMFSCMISQFFNCWDLLSKQSYKCYCWQWWSVRFKILEVNEEVSGKEVVSCKFGVSLKWILIKQFLKGKFQILYEVNGTILISTRQEFPPRPSYSCKYMLSSGMLISTISERSKFPKIVRYLATNKMTASRDPGHW